MWTRDPEKYLETVHFWKTVIWILWPVFSLPRQGCDICSLAGQSHVTQEQRLCQCGGELDRLSSCGRLLPLPDMQSDSGFCAEVVLGKQHSLHTKEQFPLRQHREAPGETSAAPGSCRHLSGDREERPGFRSEQPAVPRPASPQVFLPVA